MRQQLHGTGRNHPTQPREVVVRFITARPLHRAYKEYGYKALRLSNQNFLHLKQRGLVMSQEIRSFCLAEGKGVVADTNNGVALTLVGYRYIEQLLGTFVPPQGEIRSIGAVAIKAQDGQPYAVPEITWGYEGDHDRVLRPNPGVWRSLGAEADPRTTLALEAMAGMLALIPEDGDMGRSGRIILFPASTAGSQELAPTGTDG